MATKSFETQLIEEVSAWRREGIVDARAAQRILRRYGQDSAEVAREVAAGARARSATIFGTFGAVLVGLGAILFVASNWAAMDRLTRVVVLLAALVASAALAFVMRRTGHERTGAALILVNTLVFGANIFFVGQTYHVRVGDPVLFLLWALGAIAMALAAGSRPSMFLGLASLVAWYGSLVNDWGALRIFGGSGPEALVAPAFIATGVLMLACARLAEHTRIGYPFALVTATTGFVLASAVIFLLTFEGIWRQLGSAAFSGSSERVAPQFMWSVIAIVGASVAAAIAIAWRAAWRRGAVLEAAGLVGIEALVILVIVLAPFPKAIHYAVLFDAVALGVCAWAIQVGLATGRESFINVAVALFGVLVFARYFDFFGTLLDRSVAFIGAGILLIAGSYLLDRSRRLLLERARSGGAIP